MSSTKTRGSIGGRPRNYTTDAQVDELAADAVADFDRFSVLTLRRIIRAMDLLVQNQRRMFDVMTGEQLTRQGAFQQGVIFAYKRIAAIAQSALDQELHQETVKSVLYQEPPPSPAEQGSLPEYYSEFDD